MQYILQSHVQVPRGGTKTYSKKKKIGLPPPPLPIYHIKKIGIGTSIKV